MSNIYKIMFFLSISLFVGAIILIAVFGLNLGVDFKGGSVLEAEFAKERPPVSDIQAVLSDLSVKDVSLSLAGERGIILKMPQVSEEQHLSVLAVLKSKFPDNSLSEKRFDSIGPVVGGELKTKSVHAIIILLIAITVYIAMVFRKMAVVVSPWIMGVAAMLALFHDIIIPLGVFSLLGHFYGVEISAVFVAAILTILGFSVSDTVVIFDRIRENVIRNKTREDFGRVVHKSVMQTLTRSLNTTFTVLLSLIAIYFFGGESLRYFSLALIIGIFLGAYSSIFVASPLLVWWSNWSRTKSSSR